MLRILVISLLVANLLLLGFQCSKPEVQTETVVKQTVVEDTSIPTIHLLSEMMQDQDLMAGNRQCFSLGPFHTSEDRDDVRALLQEVSASISERETQALVEKGYWVFMSPYESLLEANQALISLQALGLKDIGVIYNGEWKNAISLGYFLRQENAQRRKKSLEERDYTPSIRVQRQSESRYWLDYEQYPGSVLITLDMQNRPNDFMQRTLPCPELNPFEDTGDSQSEEVDEPPTEDSGSPQPVEVIEPQPEESDSTQAQEAAGSPLEEDAGLEPEEVDGSQPGEGFDSDPEQAVEDMPVDSSEETLDEINVIGIRTDVKIKTVNQVGTGVGTGPEIGFGAEPESSDETEPEEGSQTEPESGDETETDNG